MQTFSIYRRIKAVGNQEKAVHRYPPDLVSY